MTEEKTTVLSLVTKDTTFDVNNFDKILKAMGTKGRYFMLNKFLFFFIITLAAMNIGSSSFTEVKHEYYCSVPKAVVENITKVVFCTTYSNSPYNFCMCLLFCVYLFPFKKKPT